VAINRSGNSQYMIVTSSTRPASPTDGQIIYETDTNLVYYYDGAVWRMYGLQTVGHTVLGVDATTITVTLPTITNGLHLLVYALVQTSSSAITTNLCPNNDTTSGNYFHQRLFGQNASVTAAQTTTAGARMGNLDNGSTYWCSGNAVVYNYAGSGQKTIQALYGSPQALSTSALMHTEHCIWKSTAAITSLVLVCSSGNIRTGSMLSVQVQGSI